MQSTPHRLRLTVVTPEVVTEGEAFNIGYKVTNIGNTPFPGGSVVVEISWPSLDPKVYQPIVINRQLSPSGEFEENSYSQAPLVAGYTWFHVYQAIDSHGAIIEVFNASGGQLFPYRPLNVSPTAVTLFRQPAHAVRAKTHEEISQEEQVKISTEELRVAGKTLRWAIIAFVATVSFGLLDLLLRVLIKG